MYLPFLTEPRMLNMGLRPLNPTQWMEPDEEWVDFHHHKQSCLTERRDNVLRTLPESVEAQQEFFARLRQHLITDHTNTFTAADDSLIHQPSDTMLLDDTSAPPIQTASLWVQDDLCLLQASPEGYRLTAASLCSPSYWHLEDKIGKTLNDIHAPVPGYTQTLSSPVNHFFDRLEADHPVWRANWSVTAHPGLMQRFDPPSPGDPEHDPLWLRVERQTLTRLPDTRAVCFTIRIHRYPLKQAL